MKDETDLSGVKTLRLFPLPGVVLFPHAILPLHIFEPRYRQMTEDALASDCLLTIVMVRSSESAGIGHPKLENYGCVGRILKHDRLPDGRFGLLLVGLKRVRLLREVPSDRLYRLAQAEILEEIGDGCDERLRASLLLDFRRYLEPRGVIDPDFESIISSDLSFGILVDILAHSLTMDPAMKQRLLEESRVQQRAEVLRTWLLEEVERRNGPSTDARIFPPSFSEN